MVKKYTKNIKLEFAYQKIFSSINATKYIPIHDVIALESGKNLPKSKMIDGNYKVYGGGGITNNTHNHYNIDYATIAIGRVGARCGCIFDVCENSWVTDNALYIKTYDEQFYLPYLKHFLSFSNLNKYANNAMQPVISKTRIKEIKIPLVELEIQKDIADLLDSIENKKEISSIGYEDVLKSINTVDIWEDLVSQIQTQQTLLKKLRQSILQEAIEGKLTASWREKNPDVESASVLLEKIKTEKEELVKAKKLKKQKPLGSISDDEIPFEISDGWVWCYLSDYSINRDGERIPISKSERDKRKKIYDYYGASGIIDKIDGFTHSGTFLLIGEDGANLIARSTAIAFIASGKFWVNNHAHVLEFFDFKSLKYVEKYINSLDLKPYITGGFQPKLSQTNLNKILLPLPPFQEQTQIVKKVESLFKLCDKLEEQIERSKESSEKLMQSVLREAFEQKETLKELSIDEKALTAMAYIIENVPSKKLGHIKLQKILYMVGAVNNIDFGFNYKKCAFGPYDKPRLQELDKKLETAQWFKMQRGEGEKARIDYIPLVKKDDYKANMNSLEKVEALKKMVKLMSPLSMTKAEVVATLYAVRKEEEKNSGFIPLDEVIIEKSINNWHERKKEIDKKEWKWGMKWLKNAELL